MLKKDVEHLAKLANIKLTEEELQLFGKQLQETISYIENLNELDTENVVPTSHASNQMSVTFTDGEENTRGLSVQEATQNAEKHKKGYFEVPRIM